jgi:signal transduction histidine kinase
METAIFRIVQEAIHNAAQHAEPTRVEVRFSFEPDAIIAQVSDDGVGLADESQPISADGTGFGLAGMRERASLLGGELLVDSPSGQGTKITATIPCLVRNHAKLTSGR